MGNLNHSRTMPGLSLIILLMLFLCVFGCTSIHSEAVRDLIEIETDQISKAKDNAKEFVNANNQAIVAWKKSVSELSRALQRQKNVESVHALIFSASQNIETKTGVDAHAAGYLIGELYLAERMGLEQTVLDQFNEDYETLKKLAKQTDESWAAIKKTQKKIHDFSVKSSLASVDKELAKALIVEFGGDTEAIDNVLKRSKQVNEALKQALGLGLLKGMDTKRAQTVLQDVVILLERIKE